MGTKALDHLTENQRAAEARREMPHRRRRLGGRAALACCVMLCAVSLPLRALAGGRAELTAYTSGQWRWKDVAGNVYAPAYMDSYSYTQATVIVNYDTNATILGGTLVATNLKPNFAYQFKLSGFPETHSNANERLGFSGRWWRQEWLGTDWSTGWNLNSKGDGSFPNPNDTWYIDHKGDINTNSPTGRQYRFTGYRPFDYFITDSNGCATLSFAMRDAYHVLFGSWQGPPEADDGPMKLRTFDPVPDDDAYDVDYGESTVGVYGEWERLPKGGVYIAPGDYTLDVLLTEESFHESGIGGWWAHMGHGTAHFTIVLPRIETHTEPAHGGTILPGGAVEVPCGGGTNLSITPADYWDITNVVVNGASVGVTGAWSFADVTNHQSLAAYLSPRLASHDVPKWWLAAMNPAWSNDFDAAATNDQDNDLLLTWQEYLAGTHADDAESVFEIAEAAVVNGSNCLTWFSPVSDPSLPPFGIMRATNLHHGWKLVGTASRSPDGTNVWCDPDSPFSRRPVFYRLVATAAD